jgi:hypothetical protein
MLASQLYTITDPYNRPLQAQPNRGNRCPAAQGFPSLSICIIEALDPCCKKLPLLWSAGELAARSPQAQNSWTHLPVLPDDHQTLSTDH